MEAMASGCQVITSQFSALPETLADFGMLIPLDDKTNYLQSFIKQTIAVLKQSTEKKPSKDKAVA
jgi:glycosyltransferase involved in cell wall biosynthesis